VPIFNDFKDEQRLSEPQWWFNLIVKPNFDEFTKDEKNKRRKVNAIITTYHFWERLYHYREQNDPNFIPPVDAKKSAIEQEREREKQFREELETRCPDIKLLGEFTNAAKHHLRRQNSGHGAARTASDIFQESDTHKSVREVLEKVMRFWECCL
jgi:hypothetical protein